MTLPRSAAEVLSGHVVFEPECIDRIYCNLYVPKLQRDLGVVGFIGEHLGKPVASTAVLADRTEAFYAGIKAFAARNGIPLVEFASGQRKDDVMREHLAQFLAAGRTEGVVFIGRAQEKVSVWATTRRRDAEGKAYPWIVRESRVVTQWYFYCYDACGGPYADRSVMPHLMTLCWPERVPSIRRGILLVLPLPGHSASRKARRLSGGVYRPSRELPGASLERACSLSVMSACR